MAPMEREDIVNAIKAGFAEGMQGHSVEHQKVWEAVGKLTDAVNAVNGKLMLYRGGLIVLGGAWSAAVAMGTVLLAKKFL